MKLLVSSILFVATARALPKNSAATLVGTGGFMGMYSALQRSGFTLPTSAGRSVQSSVLSLHLLTSSVPRANQLIPVVVGGPQDTFAPNSVVAAVGDVVQFQFSNGNHTATQSTLEAPCSPLEGGVNSGHIPFEDGQIDVGTFNMPVTSTEPMFIFCATGPHCQEGQVMIVNPYV
jgi:plastocyanin